jgi:hypothetical protein
MSGMLSVLVAAMALQSSGGATATPQAAQASGAPASASDLISRMLGRYAQAQSVVGTIEMTQEAKGVVVTTDTELQFERPDKIYLRQVEHSSEGRSFLLTSDGTTFSYDRPPNHLGPTRYTEPTQTRYKKLDLGEMYTATRESIVDPNHMLNIAIGRTGDLKKFAAQLANFQIVGSQKVGDETIYEIVGKYALQLNAEASADFDMYISSSGDFRKLSVRQSYGVAKHPEIAPIPVTTTWISTLQVNAKPNPSLFKTVS